MLENEENHLEGAAAVRGEGFLEHLGPVGSKPSPGRGLDEGEGVSPARSTCASDLTPAFEREREAQSGNGLARVTH